MNCGPYGFLDKKNSLNEKKIVESYWNELVTLYGVEISYYIKGYSLSSHNFVYGESPEMPFLGPFKMKALANLSDDMSLLFGKIGLVTNSELSLVIPISLFTQTFSALYDYPEPHPEDLVCLDVLDGRPGGTVEYLNVEEITLALSGIKFCKTPEEYNTAMYNFLTSYQEDTQNRLRSAPIFEITEKKDLNVSRGYNFMGWSFVWACQLKKFDYSFEYNAPLEAGSYQVSDETFYGKLSGTPVDTPPKPYDQSAENASEQIWNYDSHGGYDSVYGSY